MFNHIRGVQNGALTHSGIENMIADGIIEMGSSVELVVTAIKTGEVLPRVVETRGILGDTRVYGIAVGGDADGVYDEEGGGSDPAAVPVISGGGVTAYNIFTGGNDYIVPPIVTIDSSETTGSGATATAILTNGKVTSITADTVGSGYSAVNPPVIRFTPSPRVTTRATTEPGQTVRVLTRGKCPARVTNFSAVNIGTSLTPSQIPGILQNATSLGEDLIAISLNEIAFSDVEIGIVEVVKTGAFVV